MVTLRDVAAKAGVSVRTVSNVANGFALVSKETRERVQRVIDETGYRPNLAARSLRRGRSGLIGLVVPEIDVAYFAELARFFIHELSGHDETLVIDQTDGDPEREWEIAVHPGRSSLFDGLILNSLELDVTDLAQRTAATPIVLIGEQPEAGTYDHVAIDNVAAAREATEHLLGSGRQRIAAIGGRAEGEKMTTALRRKGFHDALEAAGVRPEPALEIRSDVLHRSVGATGIQALLDLDDPPDAILCMNDLVALGALAGLENQGVRVPDDIALVGFDDIEDGRFRSPTLTTISPDKQQIAHHAVELLLRRMDGYTGPPERFVTDYTLTIRESTLGRTP